MSNVEHVSIEDQTANLLLNKLQRHRGDTLNSRMLNPSFIMSLEAEFRFHSNRLGPHHFSAGGHHRREARALVRILQSASR